jgi:hypothetical protein
MRTPSKIEAAGGPADTSKQQIEANSITWKRDYKGCMVTIFGSRSAGWNVQIDKREPIILGYTRPRAIKYAKELIDEEQAKFHSRSAGGLPRNYKASPGSARHSFPTVISADRRRGWDESSIFSGEFACGQEKKESDVFLKKDEALKKSEGICRNQ